MTGDQALVRRAHQPRAPAGRARRRHRRHGPLHRPLGRARACPPEALARMAPDAMVFAMANPTPEVTPEEAAPVRARSWPPAARTTPTRSTTCSPSPASSAARSTSARRRSPSEMKMAAAARDRRRSSATTSCARTTSSPRSSTATSPRPSRPRRSREAARAGRRGDGEQNTIGFAAIDEAAMRRPRAAVPARRRCAGGHGVTLTGATGLIGDRLVGALRERGDEVTVLSRDTGPRRRGARRGRRRLGPARRAGARRGAGRPRRGRPPRRRGRRPALDRRRRAGGSARAARSARATSSPGLRAADPGARACSSPPRPSATTASTATSALAEDTPPGDDFLAGVCVAWEREADAAAELGLRVAKLRTGVVLDRAGGALAKMLPFFKARRRRPGGRRAPVPALDPRRRRRRPLPRRARRRGLGGRRYNGAAPGAR